jgi:hypothetical protein
MRGWYGKPYSEEIVLSLRNFRALWNPPEQQGAQAETIPDLQEENDNK